MNFYGKICLAVLFLLPFCSVFAAYENEMAIALDEAKEYEQDKDYSAAAKKYLAVELYAEAPAEKANALLLAARNYRLAGHYGNELDCLLRLTVEHINRIDYKQVINRIYEIGDEFFDGHIDRVVSFLPFIHDANRMEDAYSSALKLAPSAPQAPNTRLRLARIHQEENHLLQAVDEYKEIMDLHPDSEAARYAYVELAGLYCLLAERGDGDGSWAKLATKQLDDFIAKYPADPEITWAKQKRAHMDELNAKRLYGLASYYHKDGKDAVAKKYLGQIVRDYGASENAIPAEQLLAEIDRTYTPPEKTAKRTEIPQPEAIKRNTIPLERARIILVPENSNGRHLLPIRDLELNRVRDTRTDSPERTVSDEDI